MGFHAVVPLLAFFGLVRFFVAFAILVIGGWRGCNQCGVNNGALALEQPLLRKVDVDFGEDGFGQLMIFQQAAEFEQIRRVWRGLPAKVNADKAPDGLAVVRVSSMPSSESPKQCCATYMRSIRSTPIGGDRGRPCSGSTGQFCLPVPTTA